MGGWRTLEVARNTYTIRHTHTPHCSKTQRMSLGNPRTHTAECTCMHWQGPTQWHTCAPHRARTRHMHARPVCVTPFVRTRELHLARSHTYTVVSLRRQTRRRVQMHIGGSTEKKSDTGEQSQTAHAHKRNIGERSCEGRSTDEK
jgi:hypothetical protein